MYRLVWAVMFLLVWAVPVWGAETADEVKIRHWHLGIQGVTTWRNTYDVFDRPQWPPLPVEEEGNGLGLVFGYRFGDRFLLELQALVSSHELPNHPAKIHDVEALFTGTVLFRQRSFFQPFLRGGFGVGGEILTFEFTSDKITSYGPSAIAGGGFQLRLCSHLSLDFEGVSTFTNFVAASHQTESGLLVDEYWKVRETNWGWRLGIGVVWWF